MKKDEEVSRKMNEIDDLFEKLEHEAHLLSTRASTEPSATGVYNIIMVTVKLAEILEIQNDKIHQLETQLAVLEKNSGKLS